MGCFRELSPERISSLEYFPLSFVLVSTVLSALFSATMATGTNRGANLTNGDTDSIKKLDREPNSSALYQKHKKKYPGINFFKSQIEMHFKLNLWEWNNKVAPTLHNRCLYMDQPTILECTRSYKTLATLVCKQQQKVMAYGQLPLSSNASLLANDC